VIGGYYRKVSGNGEESLWSSCRWGDVCEQTTSISKVTPLHVTNLETIIGEIYMVPIKRKARDL